MERGEFGLDVIGIRTTFQEGGGEFEMAVFDGEGQRSGSPGRRTDLGRLVGVNPSIKEGMDYVGMALADGEKMVKPELSWARISPAF